MTTRERLFSLAGGAAAGAFGGLFGVGGGIVLVPVLTGALGRTQHEAHGTSLAAIGATAIAGVVVYGVHGQIDWIAALVAGAASVFTVRLGARTASRMSTRNLRLAFAALLVIVSVRLLWKADIGAAPLGHAGISVRIVFDLALGAGVGFLSGLMGVGGGMIAVPAFTLLLGMSQQRAQGTSLALIMLAAPVGAIEHARRGNVVGRLAVLLAIGSVAGAAVTSALVQTAPGPALTRAFAVFLLLNAVPMGYRAWRAGTPKDPNSR